MISLVIALTLLPFISAKTIDVVVGGPGKLLYTPEYVAADVGDYVRFHFQQKNHTATQSSFATPCYPRSPGFDSGFNPVPDDQTDNFPYYDVPVTSVNPVWVYCRQASHCSQGMVFAINPPASGNTFDQFKQNALISATATPASSSYPAPTDYYGTNTDYYTTTTDYYPTSTYDSYYPSASASAPANHHVVVGGDAGLVYTPPYVQANVGDTVTFEFKQKNHTVTESSFADPCRKLEFTSPTGEIGFDSGFMPVAQDQTSEFPSYTITVNDTKPVWAYCRQVSHCGQGMVFAVNPPSSGDKTFDNFKANAIRINGTASTTASSAQNSSSSTAQRGTSSYANGAAPAVSGGIALALLAGVGSILSVVL